MIEAGDYILSNVGFSGDGQPFISLEQNNTFGNLAPLGQIVTFRFDTRQRYCTGWRDIASGERHGCPDHLAIDPKYEQCPACQKRTGFNPAFYHATSVSDQQEQRNLQPHLLYLAHFGAGIIKVGISYAARGNGRLLEQGARTALILDTFPTAHIARQYEARIAALPGVAETVAVRKKIEALRRPYDPLAAGQELAAMRTAIEQALNTQFTQSDATAYDAVYFPNGTPDFTESFDCTDQHLISGKVIGMLGSLLFCVQQDTLLFLPLKKYTGYPVTLSFSETPITLPARQTSLF